MFSFSVACSHRSAVSFGLRSPLTVKQSERLLSYFFRAKIAIQCRLLAVHYSSGRSGILTVAFLTNVELNIRNHVPCPYLYIRPDLHAATGCS